MEGEKRERVAWVEKSLWERCSDARSVYIGIDSFVDVVKDKVSWLDK